LQSDIAVFLALFAKRRDGLRAFRRSFYKNQTMEATKEISLLVTVARIIRSESRPRIIINEKLFLLLITFVENRTIAG